MNADGTNGAAVELTPTAAAPVTNEQIMVELRELRAEVVELRTQAQAIASAAGEAMEQVKSGGILGMLGLR